MKQILVVGSLMLAIGAQAFAEKGGETVTPDMCQARGFSVRITKQDATLYRVEVKVAKDAKEFEKLPEAVLISDECHLSLKIVVHSSGDRWISFSISKRLLNESKLLVGNNDDNTTIWYMFLLKDFPVSGSEKLP